MAGNKKSKGQSGKSNGKPKGKTAKGKGAKKGGSSRGELIGIGSVVAVLLVVAAIAFFSGGGGESGSDESSPEPGKAIAPDVWDSIANVPEDVLTAAGAGGDDVTGPTALPAEVPPQEVAGKPLITYVGAEYCPFCASQRWAVVQALSRFGTFTGVKSTTSATDDVYPDTPTVTFAGSSYDSDYIAFSSVETADRNGTPLEQMTKEQEALFDKYNAPPYVDKGEGGGIPFLMIADRHMKNGTSLNPQLLEGMSFEQIAASMSDPSSSTGQSIDAAANILTAAICEATGGEPTDVCDSPAVKAGATRLQGA